MSYKFYMERVNADGTTITDENGNKTELVKDLEQDFAGLKYSKIEGIEKRGKQRVYTEEFAESESLSVYVPERVTNQATELALTLYFIGENRYEVFDEFNEYISQGFHKYWDTARNKEFVFYIEKELDVSETMWYGSTPYITVKYTLSNTKGKTTNHEA